MEIYTCSAQFIPGDKYKGIYALSIISQYCDGADIQNYSSWMTRTYLFYADNLMAGDVLATQGARALAAMVLT